MSKHLLFVLCCISALSASAQSFEQTHLFIPIHLDTGVNTINLEDFFIDANSVTGITQAPHYNIKFVKGVKTISVSASTDAQPIVPFTFSTTSGTAYTVMIYKTHKKLYTISYKPKNKKYKKVQVAGDFNKWAPNKGTMEYKKGEWRITLALAPGNYKYRLVLDSIWSTDSNNPDSVSNGSGGYNSVLNIKEPSPESAVSVNTQSYTDSTITISAKGKAEYVYALWNNILIPVKKDAATNSFTIAIPTDAKKYLRSHIRVYACNTEQVANDVLIPLKSGHVIINTNDLNRTDEQHMVMYFMLVDRFYDGDSSNDIKVKDPRVLPQANYYGGDLEGILQKLNTGFFKQLGINTIWVSPLVQNPMGAYQEYPEPRRWFSGYHGYWPVYETKIDIRFGNDDVLRQIVATAHRQGINVLMDFVSNHVHEENPLYHSHPEYFNPLVLPDGRKNIRLFDEYRLTTWFDTFMPDIDYTKPAMVELMTDSAVYWIKKFGLDGFRHDAVKHVPNEFWVALTRKLKEQVEIPEHRTLYQIGETFGSPDLISSYVGSGQLDAQFDFNLYFDIRDNLLKDDRGWKDVIAKANESFSYYGWHSTMGLITGNHDMPRFISFAGKAITRDEDSKEAGWTRDVEIKDTIGYYKLTQLHAIIMSMPEVPIIYYADEFGQVGAGDPDNRRMMRFNGLNNYEQQTLARFKKLVYAHDENMASSYGETQFDILNKTVMCIKRTYFSTGSITLINKSSQPQSITFVINNTLAAFKPKFIFKGANNVVHNADGSYSVTVTVSANGVEVVQY